MQEFNSQSGHIAVDKSLQDPMMQMSTLGISEKEIGGVVYRLSKLNVIPARKLQMRIAKTLGAPLITFFGSAGGEDSEVEIESKIISHAIMSIDVDESVNLIADLCNLTINTSKGRQTRYKDDFDADNSDDLELATWVIDVQFRNFITAFMQSNILGEAMGIVGMNAQSESNLPT